MIDTTIERPIPLTQAADALPRRRAGRKTHVSTLYRWAQVGCRGVVLECIQIGATRCTSREALQRFFERLGRRGISHPTGVPRIPCARSAIQRRRESERAGRRLEERGA
jgi:hypothetical protein